MLIMHMMTVHVRPNLKVLSLPLVRVSSARIKSTSFRILIALKSYLPDCLLVWEQYIILTCFTTVF
jgi:hypothetical protein